MTGSGARGTHSTVSDHSPPTACEGVRSTKRERYPALAWLRRKGNGAALMPLVKRAELSDATTEALAPSFAVDGARGCVACHGGADCVRAPWRAARDRFDERPTPRGRSIPSVGQRAALRGHSRSRRQTKTRAKDRRFPRRLTKEVGKHLPICSHTRCAAEAGSVDNVTRDHQRTTLSGSTGAQLPVIGRAQACLGPSTTVRKVRCLPSLHE